MDSLASRYALALLSIAKEEDKVNEYLKQIEEIETIFLENEGLYRILKDYGLTVAEKQETIDLLFKNKLITNIYNFLNVVVINSKAKYFLEIFKEYKKQTYIYLNIKVGIVYSTTSLSADQMKKITQKVSKIVNNEVILKNKIDKSLIGGLKIDIDGFIIDDSIQNRFELLKREILNKKGEAQNWINQMK